MHQGRTNLTLNANPSSLIPQQKNLNYPAVINPVGTSNPFSLEQRKRSKIRISGSRETNKSGISYYDSKEGLKAQHASINLPESNFTLNANKRSGSLKQKSRNSSDFEAGRYSSLRRRPNPVVTEEYFAKRSTSVADSHSLSKLNIKKKEQQKNDLEF